MNFQFLIVFYEKKKSIFRRPPLILAFQILLTVASGDARALKKTLQSVARCYVMYIPWIIGRTKGHTTILLSMLIDITSTRLPAKYCDMELNLLCLNATITNYRPTLMSLVVMSCVFNIACYYNRRSFNDCIWLHNLNIV